MQTSDENNIFLNTILSMFHINTDNKHKHLYHTLYVKNYTQIVICCNFYLEQVRAQVGLSFLCIVVGVGRDPEKHDLLEMCQSISDNNYCVCCCYQYVFYLYSRA